MKKVSYGNPICGRNGCDKDVERKVDFELGFSAGFCKDCAERLEQQGLTIKVTDII